MDFTGNMKDGNDNIRRLPKELDWLWHSRWASYWIGDRELFDFKGVDFDRKAEELSLTGINTVITFGRFHFIWSFIDDWPAILKMTGKICDSCHKHGIRVVEHHSAIGMFAPIGKEERDCILAPAKANGFSAERHPGFLETLDKGDCIYKGIPLSSLRQIDPRTGLFARAGYKAYPFCPNNPVFQKLYFGHLAELYRCGIDGIMSDDVGFWLREYSCGCVYCRRKFECDTNHAMPPSGIDDSSFYGNLDNLAYRAWILWRIECHREHQQRLCEHFRSHGLELARPIYSSSNTNAYSTRGMGVALDNLDGLYNIVFTEVNSTEPQAHCWLRISAEAKQKNSLASRNSVPSMSLFYPHNKEENLFCWAMTKTWGQNYWGTNWHVEFSKEIEMFSNTFNFEKEHKEIYETTASIAEIAVLYSARTTWLHKDADGETDYVTMSDPSSTDCWAGWCEILTLSNMHFDVLGEKDIEENRIPDRLRLIIVPNAVCLSEKAVSILKTFVKNGGKLIVTGQSGIKNETGALRKKYILKNLTGSDFLGTSLIDLVAVPAEKAGIGLKGYRHKRSYISRFSLLPKTRELLKTRNGGFSVMFKNSYGKGEVITFAGKPGRIVCVNRHKRTKIGKECFSNIHFNRNNRLIILMRDTVRHLLGGDIRFETEKFPQGFITGFFADETRAVIHIVNAAGTLADSGKCVPIPAPLKFPRAETLPEGGRLMRIKLKYKGSNAVIYSPELSLHKTLKCFTRDDYTVIEIPSELINCYSVIVITSSRQ